MKKVLCVSIFLLLPAICHAQKPVAGMSGSSTAPGGAGGASGGGGVGGGYSGGSGASVTPAITRSHGPVTGVTAYRNSGTFELTEVLPWEQAVELGQPKAEKSLATIAREARERKSKETVAARATLTN